MCEIENESEYLLYIVCIASFAVVRGMLWLSVHTEWVCT